MLNELRPVAGARKTRKRVGRGNGSGLGKTSGRGQKGQGSRKSGNVRPGFEGGQIPFFQRIPKRGFNNVNHIEYAVINLSELNVFENGTVITKELLIEKGLIKKELDGIKLLANGDLEKKLTVKVAKFSKSAKEAIEKLGGTCEEVK